MAISHVLIHALGDNMNLCYRIKRKNWQSVALDLCCFILMANMISGVVCYLFYASWSYLNLAKANTSRIIYFRVESYFVLIRNRPSVVRLQGAISPSVRK